MDNSTTSRALLYLLGNLEKKQLLLSRKDFTTVLHDNFPLLLALAEQAVELRECLKTIRKLYKRRAEAYEPLADGMDLEAEEALARFDKAITPFLSSNDL